MSQSDKIIEKYINPHTCKVYKEIKQEDGTFIRKETSGYDNNCLGKKRSELFKKELSVLDEKYGPMGHSKANPIYVHQINTASAGKLIGVNVASNMITAMIIIVLLITAIYIIYKIIEKYVNKLIAENPKFFNLMGKLWEVTKAIIEALFSAIGWITDFGGKLTNWVENVFGGIFSL